MGLGLLGIAPFTPPNPYMLGLLLAVFQVRLGHTITNRWLRAHARRHVTEVVLTEESVDADGVKTLVLSVQCDGGLSRSLRASSAPAGSAQTLLADVLQHGGSLMCLDEALGSKTDPEAFDRVLSSGCSLVTEEFNVKPYPDESQEEANKVTQSVLSLTRDQLKGAQSGDSITPDASLSQIDRRTQWTAWAITLGGVVIFASGRYQDARAARRRSA